MQLEYAALDAVVLIHIFSHVRGHSQPAGKTKIEWKSHIVSCLKFALTSICKCLHYFSAKGLDLSLTVALSPYTCYLLKLPYNVNCLKSVYVGTNTGTSHGRA